MNGVKQDEAKRLWRALGGTVCARRRTGETVWRHPKLIRPIVMSNRRKDVSATIWSAIQKLQREQEEKWAMTH